MQFIPCGLLISAAWIYAAAHQNPGCLYCSVVTVAVVITTRAKEEVSEEEVGLDGWVERRTNITVDLF